MTTTETETPQPVSKLKYVRMGVKFVAGRAVATTVAALVHQNTEGESTRERVQLTVGAFVLGEMVTAKASAFVGEQFDSLVEQLREAKTKAEQAKSEIEND